MFTFEQ